MTIENAKAVYLKYNCSLFAMAREEKNTYDEYRQLNISELTQEKWRQELLMSLFDEIRHSGEENIFIKLYNIAESRLTKENLTILCDALGYVEFKDSKSRAYVCEAVLGRKDIKERSGLVFGAYDLGEQALARKLLLFVNEKLSCETLDEKIAARLQRNINKCHIIDSDLGLGIYAERTIRARLK